MPLRTILRKPRERDGNRKIKNEGKIRKEKIRDELPMESNELVERKRCRCLSIRKRRKAIAISENNAVSSLKRRQKKLLKVSPPILNHEALDVLCRKEKIPSKPFAQLLIQGRTRALPPRLIRRKDPLAKSRREVLCLKRFPATVNPFERNEESAMGIGGENHRELPRFDIHVPFVLSFHRFVPSAEEGGEAVLEWVVSYGIPLLATVLFIVLAGYLWLKDKASSAWELFIFFVGFLFAYRLFVLGK
jgi:hypothetical protein